MSMSPAEVSEKLSSDEMQTLMEKAMAKYNQEFEVIVITKVGSRKSVTIQIKSGLRTNIIV